MAEDAVEDAEVGAGLVFHEGMRLTGLKLEQNLSIDYPKLEPLHHIKIEFMFHYHKIRTTWTRAHVITLVIGWLAVLLSGWDLGIGELATGGDFHAIGANPTDADSGLRNIAGASFALVLITLGLWFALLMRLWSLFPLMRSQAISLYVALLAAEVSQFWAHGFDPAFPIGLDSFSVAVAGVGIVLIAFVGFILQRAVLETRDVHVEERHWHPDPRQMEIAARDHSLFAWGAALLLYCTLTFIHGWSGAHYVAVRQPDAFTGWWLLLVLHFLSGVALVWLMIHVLWYPQLMLGSGEIRIESDRARQVSSTRVGATAGTGPTVSRSGRCPDCGLETPVKMRSSGDVEASCAVEGCRGAGAPGEKCAICGQKISSRVLCGGCGTSAPVGDHFAAEEAW